MQLFVRYTLSAFGAVVSDVSLITILCLFLSPLVTYLTPCFQSPTLQEKQSFSKVSVVLKYDPLLFPTFMCCPWIILLTFSFFEIKRQHKSGAPLGADSVHIAQHPCYLHSGTLLQHENRKNKLKDAETGLKVTHRFGVLPAPAVAPL